MVNMLQLLFRQAELCVRDIHRLFLQLFRALLPLLTVCYYNLSGHMAKRLEKSCHTVHCCHSALLKTRCCLFG